MYADALRLNLYGAKYLLNPNAPKWCNGIGAQWMWAVLRDLVSDINPAFIIPSAIHDVLYEIGGTDDDRKKADDEWLENCLIVTNDRYGWYNPFRYHYRKQARKYHALLRISGGLAWNGGTPQKAGDV